MDLLFKLNSLIYTLILINLHKKIKEAIAYGKINYNNANFYGTNMMTKLKAPFYNYENPVMNYQNSFGKNNESFGIFYSGTNNFRVNFSANANNFRVNFLANNISNETQPWWLGGRAYDQIQVGCHSCLGGFESRLRIISIV